MLERGDAAAPGCASSPFGVTSMVEWDGKMVEMYHYVINNEYPYSVGCLRGAPGMMSHDMVH